MITDLYQDAGSESVGFVPDEAGADATGVPTDSVDATSNAMEAGPADATAGEATSRDTPVVCGGSGVICKMPSPVCCVAYSVPQGDDIDMCSPSFGNCSGLGATPVLCTSSTQCASGTVCCGTSINDTAFYSDVSCRQSCMAHSNDHIFCDLNVPSDCPASSRCQKSTKLSGFYVCLLTGM